MVALMNVSLWYDLKGEYLNTNKLKSYSMNTVIGKAQKNNKGSLQSRKKCDIHHFFLRDGGD